MPEAFRTMFENSLRLRRWSSGFDGALRALKVEDGSRSRRLSTRRRRFSL
jgi:hypothetical protein